MHLLADILQQIHCMGIQRGLACKPADASDSTAREPVKVAKKQQLGLDP